MECYLQVNARDLFFFPFVLHFSFAFISFSISMERVGWNRILLESQMCVAASESVLCNSCKGLEKGSTILITITLHKFHTCYFAHFIGEEIGLKMVRKIDKRLASAYCTLLNPTKLEKSTWLRRKKQKNCLYVNLIRKLYFSYAFEAYPLFLPLSLPFFLSFTLFISFLPSLFLRSLMSSLVFPIQFRPLCASKVLCKGPT